MKTKWKLALPIVLAFSVAGCGSTTSMSTAAKGTSDKTGSQSNSTADTTLQKLKKQGYVTVGFADEKPYAYKTPDGKLTGEAVEVARAVFKKLGVNTLKGQLTEFGSLIPGLNAKRFDVITAGMYITPDRAKQVDFADPEYRIGEALAVKKGNPLDLHSYKDIAANKNAKVAVMGGAIEIQYLEKTGVPKNQIVIVPDQPSAISALQAGRVNAITMTGPSLEAMLKTANIPDIQHVNNFSQPVINGKTIYGYGASAFRKNDKKLRDAFNKQLQKLKQSGELLKIIEPFGFTKQDLPGNITAEELSKPQ